MATLSHYERIRVSEPAKTLTLTDAEARLLLALVHHHADAHEFNPDPEAQKTAYAAWTLAGRIDQLLDGHDQVGP
jgi:hypothetical protein